MKSRVPTFLAGAALAVAIVLPFTSVAGPQDAGPQDGGEGAMQEMMKKAEKFITPGPQHEALSRFIGKWDISVQLCHGGVKMPGEPGTAEFSWLFEGRWLRLKSTGSIMGMPLENFSLIGYDNFKKSYVTASISSMDTALSYTEGDMDPSGKSLLSYGTIDEYLTGEHDKMVKSVWRFVSDKKIVFEIHDLPIGELNTQVIEITYTKQ